MVRCALRPLLGEVVRHRKWGFVGVIAGWDLRPTTDVSRWDGVVGLPKGGEQPFFNVVPDEHDTASGRRRVCCASHACLPVQWV